MARVRLFSALSAVALVLGTALVRSTSLPSDTAAAAVAAGGLSATTVTRAIVHDRSGPLNWLDGASTTASTDGDDSTDSGHDVERPRHVMTLGPNEDERAAELAGPPVMTTPVGSADVEQVTFGTKPPAGLVANFD